MTKRWMAVKIGEKIRLLRIRRNLTQEELANRCELTKGFISQVERDITSPSIATLTDIVESLGTTLRDLFNEREDELYIFGKDNGAVLQDEKLGNTVEWLVPNAQKNLMEPILVTLSPEGRVAQDEPHEGEEYGFVLQGSVYVVLGERRAKCRKGESFTFAATAPHWIENAGRSQAVVLWIATPPSF